MTPGSLRYRLWQFRQLLRPQPLDAAEHAEVAALLTSRQLALFDRCGAADQRHGLRVVRTLRSAGYDDPDLLVAALLHDVGKTRVQLTLFDRSLVVLAHRLWPARAAAWGHGPPRGWRRPFVVKVQHPAWSAAMAAEAGTTPGALALIRHHQERSAAATGVDRTLLIALQQADDAN
jgi:hypothetical protein